MSLNNPTIAGPTPDGSPSVSNPIQIGGVDLNGNVRKLLLEYSGPEPLGISAANVAFAGRSADAFGRARVSSPTSAFNVSFEYDAQPLLMQTVNVGAGTAVKTTNVSSVTLSTGGTTSGDGTIFQSKAYPRYEPGKSQLIQMTGVIGAYTQSVRSQVGYYDANNGVFFDMDGTSQGKTGKIAVTVRTHTSGSAVDTSVLQSSWNLDKMDGTGTSGYKLDFTKAQIFVIDFQWLGYGRIRLGFAVNGRLVYCHQIQNANLIALPWSNTGCLPIRWEIHNTGTSSGTTTATAGCASVISEGGTDNPVTYSFSASNVASLVSGIGGTRTPLISIRPKLTFNSIVNRSRIILVDFDVYDNSAATGYWELVYNGTLSGGAPTWTSVDNNSGVEFNTDSTGCANGMVVTSGYVSGGGKITATFASPSKLPLTLDAAGSTQDIFTLNVLSLGANIAAAGTLRWSETR